MSAATITGAIDFGEFPDEMLEVLQRLEYLPEFGMRAELDAVARLCLEAEAAANIAAEKRGRARAAAHALVKKVVADWSATEIEEATGYVP